METVAIPQPPPHFLLGNLPELKLEATPVESLMRLAQQYGPLFQLQVGSGLVIVASSFELADELCDTKRFDKGFGPGLKQVRAFSGDGLFSAYTHEPNWRKAHNILMPNFSHAAMKRYAPAMVEIARLLLEKWEKAADAGTQVDVPEDMTRLTLDTIGLCGFDHRFDSFRRDKPHPFVDAMFGFLLGLQENARRLPMVNKLLFRKQKKIVQDRKFINDYVDNIIQERKASTDHADKVDLLSCMLNGVDRESGEQLEDLTIRLNIVTFLIAGHETTSGLLSFAIYFLLHNPDVLAKAYEEVDRVLTDQDPSFDQIHQLQYLLQILKETLRLYPTAPLFTLAPYEDEVIGGKYFIPKGQPVQLLLPTLHRDPAIWGADSDRFNPDNFAPELEEKRPLNAYKGFGNGQRACIGRQFALQEAVLVLGMVLQRFRLVDANHYQLHMKQSLTIKPSEFHIKLERRPARAAARAPVSARPVAVEVQAPAPQRPGHNTPLLVLYGSNMGSCEAFARHIAEDGQARGFRAEVGELDAYVGKLPREGATLLVSASYNGAPPDNAVKFCQWLEQQKPALQGLRFGVFGCGNKDWAASYQRIPKLLDQQLEELGGERLVARGEGDARGDFDGNFQDWYAPLWSQLAEKLGIAEELQAEEKGDLYEVEFLEQKRENPFVAAFGAQPMTVVENREIFRAERSARHVEVVLPEGVKYRIGDHLGVVARNSLALVKRAATRFGVNPEARIRIKKKGNSKTLLPIDQVVPLGEILSEHVELQDVATRKHLKVLAEHCQCPPEKQTLISWSNQDELYRQQVLARGKSVLDLLEEHPSCELPFNLFLEMLAGLRPRYYSISSSPLQTERICSITVGVLDAPARSGKGRYRGACSTYLAGLKKGEAVYAFVRDNHANFHLPEDPSRPVLMVGPGTGLAPFRGFLQERAVLHEQGAALGAAVLFYGCRHPLEDFAYQAELEEYAEHGICQLVTAFSRHQEQKIYVQHRILEHKEQVWQLFEQGCSVYVCGDGGQMAPAVRATFAQIYQEKTGQDAESWLRGLETGGRYMVDVWSST